MQKAKVLNKVFDVISVILTVLILPWLLLIALIAVLFTNGASQDCARINESLIYNHYYLDRS